MIDLLGIGERGAVSLGDIAPGDGGAESGDVTEQLGMIEPDSQGLAAAHGEAGDRPMFPVGVDAVLRLDERHDVGEQILREQRGAFRGIAGAGQFACGNAVAVGHHDDEWLGFTGGEQVIHDEIGVAEDGPDQLVAVGAVEQVEDGIARGLVALVIIGCVGTIAAVSIVSSRVGTGMNTTFSKIGVALNDVGGPVTIASEFYDEKDYYRNYRDFLRAVTGLEA